MQKSTVLPLFIALIFLPLVAKKPSTKPTLSQAQNSSTLPSSTSCQGAVLACNDSHLRLNRLVTDSVYACNSNIQKICAQEAAINTLSALTTQAQTLQANQINTNALYSQTIQTNQVSAQDISAGRLCVSGGIVQCNPYRAFVGLSNNLTYQLGNLLTFDTVIDDPNGNILSSPTRYVAPVSGSYILNLSLRQEGLSGMPIMGIPLGRISVLVNGINRAQNYNPFLSFSEIQLSSVTALLHLNAGDVVTAKYEIIVPDAASGNSSYTGTVILSGAFDTQSYACTLHIHYLSSDCPAPCQPCAPCPPVTIYGFTCDTQWNSAQSCGT